MAGGLVVAFAPAMADAIADVPSDTGEVLFVLSIVAAVLLALGAVLFVIEVVSAVLWARESNFAFNSRFVQVRNGGLSRQTTVFPRKKIQFAYTRTLESLPAPCPHRHRCGRDGSRGGGYQHLAYRREGRAGAGMARMGETGWQPLSPYVEGAESSYSAASVKWRDVFRLSPAELKNEALSSEQTVNA